MQNIFALQTLARSGPFPRRRLQRVGALPSSVTSGASAYASQGQTYAAGAAAQFGGDTASQVAGDLENGASTVTSAYNAAGTDIGQMTASYSGILAGANILANPNASLAQKAGGAAMLEAGVEGAILVGAEAAEYAATATALGTVITAETIAAAVPVIGWAIGIAVAVLAAFQGIITSVDGATSNAPTPQTAQQVIDGKIATKITFPSVPGIPFDAKALQLSQALSSWLGSEMDAAGFPYVKPCGGPANSFYSNPCWGTDGTTDGQTIAAVILGNADHAQALHDLLASVLLNPRWPSVFLSQASGNDLLGTRGTGIQNVSFTPDGSTIPSNDPSDLIVYIACAATLAGHPNVQALTGNIVALRMVQYAWLYKVASKSGADLTPDPLYAAIGFLLDWQTQDSAPPGPSAALLTSYNTKKVVMNVNTTDLGPVKPATPAPSTAPTGDVTTGNIHLTLPGVHALNLQMQSNIPVVHAAAAVLAATNPPAAAAIVASTAAKNNAIFGSSAPKATAAPAASSSSSTVLGVSKPTAAIGLGAVALFLLRDFLF